MLACLFVQNVFETHFESSEGNGKGKYSLLCESISTANDFLFEPMVIGVNFW